MKKIISIFIIITIFLTGCEQQLSPNGSPLDINGNPVVNSYTPPTGFDIHIAKTKPFEQTDGYIQLSTPYVSYTDNFSLLLWVYPFTQLGSTRIIEKGANDDWVWYYDGTHWRFTNLSGNYTTMSLNNNEWQQVVTTYDGTTIKTYVNSILVSTAIHPIFSSVKNWITIGNYGGSKVLAFNGEMKQILIYPSKILTQNEITENYNFYK